MYFISYWVRNKKSSHSEELSFPSSLAEAVDMYCPEANLVISLIEYEIELDVCRDMYGLYADLLHLMESLLVGSEGSELYLEDSVKKIMGSENIYSIVLTDFHEPPIIYFTLKDQDVYILTRTLRGKDAIIGSSDLQTPICYTKTEFIDHIHYFLNRYISDLAEEFPVVSTLEDYHTYKETLDGIKKKITIEG